MKDFLDSHVGERVLLICDYDVDDSLRQVEGLIKDVDEENDMILIETDQDDRFGAGTHALPIFLVLEVVLLD